MSKLAETYVKYGVPSDLAVKYEKLNLSASSFRKLPNTILKEKYKFSQSEIKIVKTYLTRLLYISACHCVVWKRPSFHLWPQLCNYTHLTSVCCSPPSIQDRVPERFFRRPLIK